MGSSVFPALPPDASATKRGLVNLTNQVWSGNKYVSGSFFADNLETVTTGSITSYVATTGNDSTGNGTSGAPYATLQKALDVLPRTDRYSVLINMGAGNFAGATIDGFEIRSAPDISTGYGVMEIRGTMTLVTPAGGTGSGTISGYSAASGATPAVVTDSGQAWVVDELKGKFLVLQSGTGYPGTESTPPILPIVNNTATTLTVLGPTTAIGATYQIQDQGTWITSATTPASSTGTTGTALSTSAFNFTACSGLGLCISRIGITLSTALPRLINSLGNINLRFIAVKQIVSSGSVVGGILIDGGGMLRTNQCIFLSTNNWSVIVANSSAPVQHNISTSYFDGQGNVSSGAVSLQQSAGFGILSCFIRGYTNGISAARSLGTGLLLSATKIDGTGAASSYGIRMYQNGALPMPICGVNTSSCDISNCSVAAISLTVPGASGHLITCSGTGNGIGIQLGQGASLKVASAVTLTGTTEVSIDSNSSTLAVMRAQSPKVLTTSYGTALYE